MSKRGRPAVDTEWNSILSRSAVILPHEENDNDALVENWRLTGILPHGCKIRPGQSERASEKVWLCLMYLGGKQRVIGSGSLHQCSRLYDAALFRFEKFRNRLQDDLYNISKDQAKLDNTIEAEIVSYLTDLENLLIARGELTSAFDRKSLAELKSMDGKHSRTAMGRLEHTQFAMIDQIESLKLGLQSINESIRQTNLTLAEMNSRLGVSESKPKEQDNKTVPTIPLSPQISCFTHTTPIGVKQQTSTTK